MTEEYWELRTFHNLEVVEIGEGCPRSTKFESHYVYWDIKVQFSKIRVWTVVGWQGIRFENYMENSYQQLIESDVFNGPFKN